MLDALHVVVPTLDRRLPGVLRPVAGPRAGVLLLDGTGAQAPLVSRLYAELELYLQSMDLVTLRLTIAPGAKMNRRVSGVLGGVSLLRSMGAAHVLLITSALDPIATREEVSAGTLDSMVDLATQGHALPEIIQIVRDLTITIRDVADSVIGVATLLAHPTFAPTSPPLVRLRKRTFETAEEAAPAASPPALLLSLPSAGPGNGRDDGHGRAAQAATAQLVTQLYSWSLALTYPERETHISRTLLPATGAAPASQVRANWSSRRRWMDQQWEELLTQLAARAPESAARAREIGRRRSEHRGDGWSQRASRDAWEHLDGEALAAWLQVCSKVFSYAGPNDVATDDPAPAAAYELAQTC